MKKTLSNMFMIAACCAVFGCVAVFAQNRPPTSGGYSEASVDDARVKAAADFAVKAKAKETKEDMSLESIEKAETQVVAGTNYRLCMVIYVASKEEQTDGVTLYISAVIYQNLQGAYRITQWKDDEDNCGVEV